MRMGSPGKYCACNAIVQSDGALQHFCTDMSGNIKLHIIVICEMLMDFMEEFALFVPKGSCWSQTPFAIHSFIHPFIHSLF